MREVAAQDRCALTGAYSLRCGLTEDGLARWWDGEAATAASGTPRYHGFQLQRRAPLVAIPVSVDLEPSYDFAYGTITTGGKTSNFVSYSTTVGGTASINLTPYLKSAGPYTISFRVVSDPAASDEDGGFITPCGAILLDNISVTGGGENYFTDFRRAKTDGRRR